MRTIFVRAMSSAMSRLTFGWSKTARGILGASLAPYLATWRRRPGGLEWVGDSLWLGGEHVSRAAFDPRNEARRSGGAHITIGHIMAAGDPGEAFDAVTCVCFNACIDWNCA